VSRDYIDDWLDDFITFHNHHFTGVRNHIKGQVNDGINFCYTCRHCNIILSNCCRRSMSREGPADSKGEFICRIRKIICNIQRD
jgi:hypothetical protein